MRRDMGCKLNGAGILVTLALVQVGCVQLLASACASGMFSHAEHLNSDRASGESAEKRLTALVHAASLRLLPAHASGTPTTRQVVKTYD